ncbi:MAG: polysaccharide deacetylase family protein [Acidobacteria bacterium]|nr:polysaccharide deacetylase family protein [Acidobacteriota bacterium]
MVRRLVKSGLAHGMCWSGASLLKRTLTGWSGLPWIVAYHRVVEDFAQAGEDSIPATLISRAMLERQIDWIGRRFDFVSLDEIESRLDRRALGSRPAAAVTFDDGYADVYEQAFPLLKARGIPAAVFVVSDLIGTTTPPLFDRVHLLLGRAWKMWRSPIRDLARLAADLGLGACPSMGPARVPDGEDGAPPGPLRAMRILLETLPQSALERLASALRAEVGWDESVVARHRPLTWEMLREMRSAGITIGSHSRTHPLLTLEDLEKVREETTGSRRDLEARLGGSVRHFAYPNGWFDGWTLQAVEAAGYRCGYTSCHHRDPGRPLLTLSRTLLWENAGLGVSGRFSPAVMGCQADGTLPRMAGCRLMHRN